MIFPTFLSYEAILWLKEMKGDLMMYFGQYCMPFNALFFNIELGTRVQVGVDSSYWIGNYSGIRDGLLLLTNARLYSNSGRPICGLRQSVRIPMRQVNFVARVNE